MDKKKFYGLFSILSGALWGSSGIFVRILGENGFNSMTMTGIRMIIATIILFFVILIKDKSQLKIKAKDIWLFALTGLINMFMLNYCYNIAIEKLTISFAAVLLGIAPIFVMIMAAFLFKEKITLKKSVCALAAIGGCVLVSGILETKISGGVSGYGLAMGIIASLCYAFYSISSKILIERGYGSLTITFYAIFTVALFIWAFMDWAVVGVYVMASPAKSIAFLILNALCNSVLPYLFFTIPLKYIDAGKCSILAGGAEPSFAMIFGAIIFAEIPSILGVIGLIITIISISILIAPGKEA